MSEASSPGELPAGLNLDFVRVNDELSAQTGWFPLQRAVDEVHGGTNLLLVVAVGDLVGVEPQGQPMDGDDFHDELRDRRVLVSRGLRAGRSAGGC